MNENENLVPKRRFKEFTNTGTWEQRKLEQLAQFNPKSSLPDKFEYVDLESVVGTEMISHRTETKENAPSRAQRLAIQGDVFYQTVRPYQKNNYLFDLPHNNYVFSTGYAQLRPFGDSYFLLSRLQDDKFVFNVLERSTGTSYPAINSSDLAQIEVGVPLVVEEQIKIGDFFKNLDNTIALHQRQLDNYKELKKAMLQKIFNQELRFKDQDGNDYPDWDEKKMGEIAKIRTGYTPPRKDKNNFGGDIIWISVADMKTKYIYDTKEYLSEKDVREAKWIEADTLIMSFKLSVGVLAITKIKCMSNEAIANFKWKNDITNNEYMYAYLSSQDISTYGNNASQGISLNNESLRKIRVPVPCKEEQQKIAEFFTLLDKKVESVKKGVELFKEQKKVFMQQMFL